MATNETGVFKLFGQAVAFLQGSGWTLCAGDVTAYIRGPAKAKIKREPGGYRVVYSRKRNK